MIPAVQSALFDLDPRWDPASGLISEILHSPNVPTTRPPGSRVHPIVLSLDYALACVLAARFDRAAAVLKPILAAQFLHANHDHFGLFPRYLEEPPGGVRGLDLEPGELAAARLAHIFAVAAQHPPPLDRDLRESVIAAAWGTLRRYPPIKQTCRAVSGAAACAIAGDRLAEPRLLDFARQVLRDIEKSASVSGLGEYNSPIAIVTVVAECERIHELVRDPETRNAAEATRAAAWQLAAQLFHSPTGQFCGPHGLTEHDLLDSELGGFISARTGAALAGRPVEPAHRWSLVTPMPASLELEKSPHAIGRDGRTSFLADRFCLGSASRELLAADRRPLIAYWRDSTGQPACLRLRFLKDGRDFASARLNSVQHEHRAIAAVNFALGHGDLHESLDRPDDGQFTASDIRVRIELFASGAIAKPLGRHVELIAGGCKAAVHMPVGEGVPEPDRWAMGYDETGVCFDAVCYEGAPMRFALADFLMAVGIEIIPAEQPATRNRVTCIESAPAMRRLAWEGLSMEVGIRAE